MSILFNNEHNYNNILCRISIKNMINMLKVSDIREELKKYQMNIDNHSSYYIKMLLRNIQLDKIHNI